MTQSEIDLLNQVQKEAVQNHNRLRAKYGSPQLSPVSVCSDSENYARLDLPARRSDAVSLVVDTKLANTAASEEAKMNVKVAGNSHDRTTEEATINPKHVRSLQFDIYRH